MTVVAIHQPNFFPWLGYFDKILRSDVFILLDDSQFPKKGGGWMNRVKLSVGGEDRWFSAPIYRDYHGVLPINHIVWAEDGHWRDKLIKTLKANYAKACYFKETMAWLEPLILTPEQNIASYNIVVITEICKRIGLNCHHFVKSSLLNHQGQSNELLISLTRLVGGDEYLCGGGATGYQDDQMFFDAGIKLTYQDFKHPIYNQSKTNSFLSGLSIIDTLMHLGSKETGTLLLKTRL